MGTEEDQNGSPPREEEVQDEALERARVQALREELKAAYADLGDYLASLAHDVYRAGPLTDKQVKDYQVMALLLAFRKHRQNIDEATFPVLRYALQMRVSDPAEMELVDMENRDMAEKMGITEDMLEDPLALLVNLLRR